MFLDTVTWGIVYWEWMYHIVLDDSLTLEERKARVRLRKASRSPMNPAVLERLCERYVGVPVSIAEQISEYRFQIDFDFEDVPQGDVLSMYTAVNRAKPSHLDYRVHMRRILHTALGISTAVSVYREETLNSPADLKLNFDREFSAGITYGAAVSVYREETINGPEDLKLNENSTFNCSIHAGAAITTYKEEMIP